MSGNATINGHPREERLVSSLYKASEIGLHSSKMESRLPVNVSGQQPCNAFSNSVKNAEIHLLRSRCEMCTGGEKRKADVIEGIKVLASNLTYGHLPGVRIKRDIYKSQICSFYKKFLSVNAPRRL